ncbi:hypothetical protein CANARDRAFT_29119 [[Candida] arabinofermentans NRRL YB-2248]|uniref:Mevalonate kinase n=1 Tax=[Candida] arabinofermentans NRRL YB-2248 TaxID=983967 RepID=A0A1E4SYN5_9ASCO|nr:hypothetical protein CANARDRAFT_29119 [[Candida] arabinofermentans NRRL YB-2248]
MVQFPFVTSAPGKVIIFGEHSAVYNKPAIAAALSLRTYLLVTKHDSDDIILEFPDIDFSYKWKKSDIPLKSTISNKLHEDDELNPELISSITPLLSTINTKYHYTAAYTFLYLFVSLCSDSIPSGLTFTVRSTLPIGAGLGSSASISVCLTSAFSYLNNHIDEATFKSADINLKDSPECSFIDSWSFIGEKCSHGNPSGIDNAVATYGGAVLFQRMSNSIPSVRTSMRNLPVLNLLLTNTKTPRSTSDLVSKVSKLIVDLPITSGLILDTMESIVKIAYNLMLRPFLDSESKQKLLELIRINHGLLVSLGVSHPNLEKIKLLCDEFKVGETKLTGAGGGGCAITLIDDDLVTPLKLENLIKEFDNLGFETFKTSLGGKGVGLLVTRDEKLLELMTVENFMSFKSRDEIEESIGCLSVDEWRYW